MKQAYKAITLIVITNALMSFTSYGMDAPKTVVLHGNKKQQPHQILKALNDAHTRNDTIKFKKILFLHSTSDLEPILPEIMGMAGFYLPQDKSKAESNPAFSEILDKYCKQVNIHTAVQDAIQHQNLDKVSQLICQENINLRNFVGQTPLDIAIRCNRLEVVRMFLSMGADACKSSYQGGTTLHLAQNKPMAELLLEHGAFSCINKQDFVGQTATFEAVQYNRNDVALLLIDAGADVKLRTIHGVTILHTAIFCTKVDEALALCKKILEKGANINTQDNDQRTALHYAAENRLVHLVALLLRNGADTTLTNREGASAASTMQDKWQLTPEQFLELYKNPTEFNTIMSDRARALALKSFDYTPPKHNKVVKAKAKKPKKNKSSLTFNQRKEKAEPVKAVTLPTQEVITNRQTITHATEPLLKQTVAIVLADRVTKWQNEDWLKQEKQKAKIGGFYQYWQFKRKKLYHQLPEKTLGTLMAYGTPKPRPNKTYPNLIDTQYTLEGEMQFEHLNNPWNPGKQRQPGFYHMTRGSDGKTYHVGFEPTQNRGLRLSDFMSEKVIALEWADVQTKTYNAAYDAREGVRHALYTQ